MDRNTAAVFIMLGQSNATGHALPMRKEDVIGTPMTHVFGLRRDPNQSFDIDRLVWSGWTSADTNLGETQDNTYSVPNCLAAAWESAVDAGADLPDLYIVHVSIGAQGVTKKFRISGGETEPSQYDLDGVEKIPSGVADPRFHVQWKFGTSG